MRLTDRMEMMDEMMIDFQDMRDPMMDERVFLPDQI